MKLFFFLGHSGGCSKVIHNKITELFICKLLNLIIFSCDYGLIITRMCFFRQLAISYSRQWFQERSAFTAGGLKSIWSLHLS
jgi:hypothetical protein